jgi:hypothetical protein
MLRSVPIAMSLLPLNLNTYAHTLPITPHPFTSQNNILLLPTSPTLTSGPAARAPDAPQPSVLTQIPVVVVELQEQ